MTDRSASPVLVPLPAALIEPLVRAALAEDWGEAGDVTTQATILPETRSTARFIARQPGVLCGWDLAAQALRLTDPSLVCEVHRRDGEALAPGALIASVTGSARSLLMAERVALNFLTHLSGIASLAARYVVEVAGTRARIADTRKTLPLLRAVQKYAVRAGGGMNHRFGLYDAILIKDNHIAAAGSVAAAIHAARAAAGHLVKVEVEIDGLHQLEEALSAGPDVVLLDNFSLADLRTAVARIAGRAVVEASGGVSLTTVRAIAETGVDVISVGGLTHSAPALDIGLDF